MGEGHVECKQVEAHLQILQQVLGQGKEGQVYWDTKS